MTYLFRNRPFRRELLISVLLTAACTAGAVFFSVPAAALTFGLGAALTGCHLAFTARRYREVRRLSAVLDRILHGESAPPIAESEEGELSVLRAEIGKMTLRLKEYSEGLLREKTEMADLMADISHQLRTPLTGVNLIVTMLAAEDLPDNRRLRLCRDLAQQLRRMEWLVETLLKLSRLDAGAVTFVPVQTTAAALTARALEPLLIPLELREITLENRAGGQALSCDPAWTAEAVGNLLKNCCEHSPIGGTVRVEATETALYTELKIADNGGGFAPEDLPHVFERFYKGKNAGEQSVGIGLALARSIVAAQGGSLTAKNEDGGAAFFLRFYKGVV